MNGENSVNAESVNAEVEQPVGPGSGYIAALSFCIGGAFVGAVVGEGIRKMSQAGGPDEGGSMGVILPSAEAMGGAVWGGLAGLLVYTIVLNILNATYAQRKRVWRAILVVTLPVGIGLIAGALVGYALNQLANGAILGLIVGVAMGAIVSMRA